MCVKVVICKDYNEMHGQQYIKLDHACTFNRLPEDEPSDSKHVEGIVKIKILI